MTWFRTPGPPQLPPYFDPLPSACVSESKIRSSPESILLLEWMTGKFDVSAQSDGHWSRARSKVRKPRTPSRPTSLASCPPTTTSFSIAMTKPTIILAPGAWHSSIHYTRLTVLLETAGYPVVCRTLPSFNGDDSKPYHDTALIRNDLIVPLLREGKDVVIMAHSFGGYPAGEASYGLSKQERIKKGEMGGVVGFIWISAMLVKEGPSFKDRFPGGVWPSRFIVNVRNFRSGPRKYLTPLRLSGKRRKLCDGGR